MTTNKAYWMAFAYVILFGIGVDATSSMKNLSVGWWIGEGVVFVSTWLMLNHFRKYIRGIEG